jgi:hypothetical protein
MLLVEPAPVGGTQFFEMRKLPPDCRQFVQVRKRQEIPSRFEPYERQEKVAMAPGKGALDSRRKFRLDRFEVVARCIDFLVNVPCGPSFRYKS